LISGTNISETIIKFEVWILIFRL